MVKRQLKYAGCLATVLVTGLATAPPSQAGDQYEVHPGESIQKAVDAAQPGDTIDIAPGTYRESVRIDKSGLTLRGAGERTVIRPPGSRTANSCGKEGNGICVLGTAGHRLRDVGIHALTVSGFHKNGIWASETDRLRVRGVTARDNGQWGIAEQKSTRGSFLGNTASGNGDAGIFLANTVEGEGGALNTHGAHIDHNTVTGNRIGITIRRARHLSVDENEVTGNCSGVFIVGDESLPRAGALTVNRNDVSENNKSCPATKRLPALQGSGIVLTGAEDTRVEKNLVRDNVGSSPLSGGIVLFHSFVKVLNERHVLQGNVALGNEPADLANRDTSKTNRFEANICKTSQPAGLC
ncbi:right-handed parallel beta-helix repeat-containing protein [Streptomyces pinistramenti]|uniref:right-handed parallel beta-helix repeat-containing protein n=1 Tax=Streptomyces pinistramenti TaxID=2884812 RepID=UPI001D06742D|nr:right-handed parallel beta-helix repeat-containing protein [Streptomyces pinistramenti]MCB5907474.1 right-handed parallel beta-helix repeat-containing protein [Streptomyces pinistramenti]